MSLTDQFLQDASGTAKQTQAQATPPTQTAVQSSTPNTPLAMQFMGQSNPAFFQAPDGNPTAGNSFLDNALAGAGKAFSDIDAGITQKKTQLAAWADDKLPWQDARHKFIASIGGANPQEANAYVQQKIDEQKALDAPLRATTGGKVGNIAGNVAIAAPTMFVPGGQTLAGSMLTGALFGGVEPTATGDSTLVNAGLGALGGTIGYGATKYAIPAAISGAKSLLRSSDSKVGAQILGAAGSDADAQAAITALNASKPIVPGSLPTAGQASGNAGIAALERTASQTNPSVINQFAQRATNNNAARVNALQDVAGADGARDFFAADRGQVAKDLYGDAFSSGIDPANLTPWVKGQVTQLLQRPSIQAAMGQAKNLAAEDGIKLNDDTSLQGLHYAKQALDDQISQSARAGTDVLTSKLMDTKNMLLGVMDKMSPQYAQARATFQGMSKPINAMDTAQAIADKSINPLTGNLQPQAYARSLSDTTAKRATGFNGATLEGTMEPQQLATLNAIKDDLASTVFAQNASRAGSDTMQKSVFSQSMSNLGGNLANMVKRIPGSGVLLDNWNKVGIAQKNELATKLAQGLLDPAETARLMQTAISARPGIISGAIQKAAPATGLIGTSIPNSGVVGGNSNGTQ